MINASGSGQYDHLAATPDEEARLVELQATGLLDTEPAPEFDNIVRLVTGALNVPIAAVTLVDRDRQWFKSEIGLGIRETPRRDSFCSHAVALEQVLAVSDATHDDRFVDNPLVKGDPGIRFYLGVPLRVRGGAPLGALCAIDRIAREPTDREISLLQGLAGLVVEQIELRLAANTDSLTGALQRRAFMASAERDFARVRRENTALSCLMLDADHFKTVNDTYGHAAGDDVLQQIALIARSEIRKGDYMGRLGGEEFGIVLPGADMHRAYEIAERIREAIAHCRIEHAGNTLGVTVSIGYAALSPADSRIEDVLVRADHALYAAKTSGRDRCHAG